MNHDDYVPCLLCKRIIDKFRESFMPLPHLVGYLCGYCIHREMIEHDRTINPLPEHMRAEVEPYIQFRCDTAVAKFVLEQAESLRTSIT